MELTTQKIGTHGFEVLTDQPNDMWKGFKFGVPGFASVFYTDFFQYTSTDWTVTETDNSATQACTDAAHGRLLITNTAADNDLVSMQLTGESVLPAAGKKIWFETKLQVSDATQSDLYIGLSITDTDPITSVTYGIAFLKDDGDAYVDFQAMNNSVSSRVSAVATLANATDMTFGFVINGTSSVDYFINKVYVGTITASLPATEMRPTLTIQNGEAVAKTMSVDYLFVASER